MKQVVFDMFGVIAKLQREDFPRQLTVFLDSDVDSDLAMASYWKHRQAYDAGLITDRQYWDNITSDLQLAPFSNSDLAKAIDLDFWSWNRVDQDFVAFLGKLNSKGISLNLLSNLPRFLADEYRYYPWMSNFAKVFFSCELKLAKPDPEIYQQVLSILAISAEQMIFIDDSEKNIEAARALGIKTILYQDLNIEQLESQILAILD